MKIWVDGDACPNVIKVILFRAAKRTETMLVLVANSQVAIPPSRFISMVQVAKGFDQADNHIVQHMMAQDLVITADVPLAALVVERHGLALNPRGELYTENSMKQRLSLRDMREELRGTGVHVGGPSILSMKEKSAFANALDRVLAQSKKG
ncbi:MAG: YaiI/YqxD family protein [Legionellales bacterium]|nr:YaiI/YqxD family protein [Legionellales bacterium]